MVNLECKTPILTCYPTSAAFTELHTLRNPYVPHLAVTEIICQVVTAQTEMTRRSNQRPTVVNVESKEITLLLSSTSERSPLSPIFLVLHQTLNYNLYITNLFLLICLPIVYSKLGSFLYFVLYFVVQ